MNRWNKIYAHLQFLHIWSDLIFIFTLVPTTNSRKIMFRDVFLNLAAIPYVGRRSKRKTPSFQKAKFFGAGNDHISMASNVVKKRLWLHTSFWWKTIASRKLSHIFPFKGTFESMIFLFLFGGSHVMVPWRVFLYQPVKNPAFFMGNGQVRPSMMGILRIFFLCWECWQMYWL